MSPDEADDIGEDRVVRTDSDDRNGPQPDPNCEVCLGEGFYDQGGSMPTDTGFYVDCYRCFPRDNNDWWNP